MSSKRIQLTQLRNPECTACPLHKTEGNVCVMGRGSPNSKVLLLGEAPGAAEAETGKPFMGEAGQVLNILLTEVGLTGRVYITNVCKCRPPHNRKPTKNEIDTCWMLYLSGELRVIKPRVIVCLGRTAISQMIKGNFVIHTAYRSSRWHCSIVPTWHPAYYLHSGRDKTILNRIREALIVSRKIAYAS